MSLCEIYLGDGFNLFECQSESFPPVGVEDRNSKTSFPRFVRITKNILEFMDPREQAPPKGNKECDAEDIEDVKFAS